MMTPERIAGQDDDDGEPRHPRRPPVDITLEPMRRRHLGAVLQIEAHALHRPWSLGTFVRELSHANERTYLVARKEGSIIGFGGVMYVLDEAHITTIAVSPEHQRDGIGTRLMLALLLASIDKGMVSSSLEVRSSNAPAIRMYERFGYAPAGIRPNYYAEVGEDAVVMWAHDINGTNYRRLLSQIAATSGLHGLGGIEVEPNELGADDVATIAEAGGVTSLSGAGGGFSSITDLDDPDRAGSGASGDTANSQTPGSANPGRPDSRPLHKIPLKYFLPDSSPSHRPPSDTVSSDTVSSDTVSSYNRSSDTVPPSPPSPPSDDGDES